MRKLRKNLCSILIPLLGWLLARVGLAVVAVDELGRLRERDARPVLPPGFRMFNAELAAAHGLPEAVMLATFAGWIDHNVGKGRQPWTYNSADKWVAQEFPWMSVSTFRRKLKALDDAGLLDVCQQTQSFDRRLRVSLTTAARLSSPSSQNARSSTQIEQMALPNWQDDSQESNRISSIPKSVTPAASRAGAAAAKIAQPIADILDSREATDRAADTQSEGHERHARRPAPPPSPPTPSPMHQNAGEGEITTELDITEEAEPISAAISGVFAPPVARVLIAQYGADVVEALIADTRSRQGVTNLAGLVRTRLAQGDRIQPANNYTGGRYAGVVHS